MVDWFASLREDNMKQYDALIVFILDRSGSMTGRTQSVITHFNKYKQEMAELEQNIAMSVILFDDQYERLHVNKPLRDIPPLNINDYYARGSTGLRDAIGRTINSVAHLKNLPEKVVFVINTDGYENASREFSQEQIVTLVNKYTEKGWQFIFVGAGIDAFTTGTSFGTQSYNTFTTSNDDIGYAGTYSVLRASSASYISGQTDSVNMTETAAALQIDEPEEIRKKKEKAKTS